MFPTTAQLVFTLLLTLLLIFVTNKHRLRRPKTTLILPPGPTSWPIVGCLPQLRRSDVSVFRWIHHFMEEKGLNIACFKLGGIYVFPVTCPRIAKEILKKQDAIFSSRPTSMASGTFSWGYKSTVLSPYGDNWKKMRRVLMSEVVSPARHLSFRDKRDEEADNLVRYLYHQSKNGGVVNVRTATRHYAGNIGRRNLFNKRYFGSQIREDGGPTLMEEEHVNAAFTALKYVYAFCVSDYMPSLLGLDLDGHEKRVKEAQNTILKYHEPIIIERIEKWRNAAARDGEQPEIQDLLDVFISLKDGDGKPLLSRQEITAQTTELTMAGIDNPSSAAEWAMAELINNPCIMSKAMEELDRVVGKDRLVQEEDIPNLNYIKACVRESFRLHPMVPFLVPHVALHDTVVEGYHIPKGSHVLISRMGLGRNPKIWDNPLEYNPGRHLSDHYDAANHNDNISLVENELRFISFGIGRRGCIGITLGTTMTVMLIARMLQGFEWKPPPNVSEINLKENEDDLYPCQPVVASLTPRLPLHLYPV